jgi:mono/diheme cytochrome c family protein
MRYLRFKGILAVWAFLGSIACVTLQAQTQSQTQPKPKPRAQAQAQPKSQTPRFSGVGSEATQEDIGNLAWVAGPSGKTLPPGSGTAKQGEAIFAARCAMCHGVDTHGVHWEPMAFSPIAGPPLSLPPQKSTGPHNPWIPPITSGAPFPEVIFNTIAVEMPMFRPGTLTADQVYALSAFIFFKNGYIKEDDVMNSETLAGIKLPNAKYFPPTDDVYMDMNKRGCYKTYGVCVGN